MAGGTVLYIEDNAINVRLVERILEQRLAIQLLSATRGRAGVDLARERRPDLILVDLHPDLRHTPVIVLIAEAASDVVARVRAAGAREYLTKPLDIQQVLSLVDAHVP